MRHTPQQWLERLYARIPAFYRQQDLEIARARSPGLDDDEALARAPLRGLLQTVAEQVAAVRQDIDDLWDDFFLETADDWVVPYLGALVGTRLLPNPVGQTNRQDVRNTLAWRRTKGTPAMLTGLARGTTGWRADVVEGFRTLAWTQHTEHVRPERALTPSLRDPVALARLATAADPFAHLPDLRPPGRPGVVGRGAPAGRYDLRTAVFHLRPLQVFPLRGVTPAAAAPGAAAPAGARAYTFDPLHEEGPLFGVDAVPVEPTAFRADPGAAFGPDRDLVVRRAGVPLALAAVTGADSSAGGTDGGAGGTDGGARVAGPGPALRAVSASADGEPLDDFTFGAPDPGTRLHPSEGMRVLDPRVFTRPAEHFTITAVWFPDAPAVAGAVPPAPVRLGAVATALLPDQSRAYHRDAALGGAGRLGLRISSGGGDAGVPGWEAIPPAAPGRFPACDLALRDDGPPRAARHGGVPSAAGRYAGAVIAYLPAVFVAPGRPVDLLVGSDGSCFEAVPAAGTAPAGPPTRGRTVRATQGQAWPPAGALSPVSFPYLPGGGMHRVRGLAVPDPSRLAGVPPWMVQVHVVAGVPQLAGALVTADVPVTDALRAALAVPPGQHTWPAFSFLPSREAVADRLPVERVTQVALLVSPVAAPAPGDPPVVVPPAELVLTDRAGAALLVYLPEADLGLGGADGTWFVVGADGSTWNVRAGLSAGLAGTLPPGAVLARATCGQVLPLEGAVPLRRRRVVAARPGSGELHVDPARGRFCLAADDPLVAVPPAERDLTVDYAQAFTGPVGARGATVADPLSAATQGLPPTRVVSAGGDATVRLPLGRVHRSVAEAVAAADALWTSTGVGIDEVIEIVDSASYPGPVRLDLGRFAAGSATPPRRVTIRAARGAMSARPCLLPGPLDAPEGRPAAAVTVTGVSGLTPVEALSVDRSLLLSGLLVGGPVRVGPGLVSALRLGACTVLPGPATDEPGPAPDAAVLWDDAQDHRAQLTIASSIVGAVRTGPGVAVVTGEDSVIHRAGHGPGLAVGGVEEPARSRGEEADPGGDRPAGRVSLRRVTVIGRVRAQELDADTCLFAALVVVDSRQTGCLRFCRVEPGSVLPRHYRCVPGADDLERGDAARAAFGSLRPGSPLFAALGDAASPLVLTASEAGDQVGAFAGTYPGLRRGNLAAKLAEFLPAGLRPVVVLEDRPITDYDH
jgi:hypothetical protein